MSDFHPCGFYIHININSLMLLTSLNLRNKLKGEAPRLVLVNIPIQLKEERQERFKSFFLILRSILNKPVNCQYMYLFLRPYLPVCILEDSIVKQALQISIDLHHNVKTSFYFYLMKMVDYYDLNYVFSCNLLSDAIVNRYIGIMKNKYVSYWNQTKKNSVFIV